MSRRPGLRSGLKRIFELASPSRAGSWRTIALTRRDFGFLPRLYLRVAYDWLEIGASCTGGKACRHHGLSTIPRSGGPPRFAIAFLVAAIRGHPRKLWGKLSWIAQRFEETRASAGGRPWLGALGGRPGASFILPISLNHARSVRCYRSLQRGARPWRARANGGRTGSSMRARFPTRGETPVRQKTMDMRHNRRRP